MTLTSMQKVYSGYFGILLYSGKDICNAFWVDDKVCFNYVVNHTKQVFMTNDKCKINISIELINYTTLIPDLEAHNIFQGAISL